MTEPKSANKVAILTLGGLAPCPSSAIGGLIERDTELYPNIEAICYRGGYRGLHLGESGETGHDEDDRNILPAFEFPRIAGGKPFNIDTLWLEELLDSIS